MLSHPYGKYSLVKGSPYILCMCVLAGLRACVHACMGACVRMTSLTLAMLLNEPELRQMIVGHKCNITNGRGRLPFAHVFSMNKTK